MVLKAMTLDEVTQGVRWKVDRKEKKFKDQALRLFQH